MLQFTLRRFALFFPMLFLASVMIFAIIQAPPGDFLDDFAAMLAEEGESFSEGISMERLRAQYGLDKPIHVQYLKWIWNVLHWDLGVSLEWQKPVTDLLNQRLLMTVILGASTVLLTWTLALPIGVISAVKQYSIIDYVFTFISYIGVATPNFVLALIGMWLALSLFNANVTGLFSRDYIDADWSIARFGDLVKHLWLPMEILGTSGTARLTRIVRANLLDE